MLISDKPLRKYYRYQKWMWKPRMFIPPKTLLFHVAGFISRSDILILLLIEYSVYCLIKLSVARVW